MKVHDFAISPAVEQACVARMQRGALFSAADLMELARRYGVPQSNFRPVAYRFADRLIQRERRAGTIKRVGMRWVAVK